VIPPRMGWGVGLMLIGSGAWCLLALLCLGSAVAAVLPISPLPLRMDVGLAVFLGLCQALTGLSWTLGALSALNRRTSMTVQREELELRHGGLWRESRLAWPLSKIGRLYVEPLTRQTAILWIQIVGEDRIDITGASEAEWQWVAALLRQALDRTEAVPEVGARVNASPVDDITASPSQVRRS
jgi:hypothetical protein